MGGGLSRLGLNIELTLEADGLLPLDGHVEEGGKVIEFALHVGVPEGGVPLASTPEEIASSSELVGDTDRLLHLGSGMGVDIDAGRGGRPLGKARVSEETGGAPEKFLASAPLLLGERCSHGIKSLVRCLQSAQLGRDIPVVEAVKVDPGLLEKLEEDTHPALCVLH